MADETLDLMRGTVDVLILKTLTWDVMHGYAVSRWIRERTAGALELDDAALYQALHRMEKRGWVESEWGLSENNRRAKYYRLTMAGRRELRERTAAIRRYTGALFRVLDAEPAPGGA